MLNYLHGTLLMVKFYVENIFIILSLPKWMKNPDDLKDTFKEKTQDKHDENNNENDGSFDLTLPNEAALTYNKAYDNLKVELRNLHPPCSSPFSLSYKSRMSLMMMVRLVCVYTATKGLLSTTLLLLASQIVFAPYSMFVSAALALAMVPPLYLCHYLSFALIQHLLYFLYNSVLFSALPTFLTSASIPINSWFILMFFVVDQLLCFYCHLLTPSKSYPFRKTLVHMIYGFFHTKTFALILLLHLRNAGVQIPLDVWILDSVFGVTDKLYSVISSRGHHFMGFLYQQHRMAHLPKVYEHAHKLHHYLQGTLAFDAHIYGNGMPEEFFFLLLELVVGVQFGLVPATLNRLVLQFSIDNKFGHTQKPEDTCGDNFHADHHLVHVKNFGIHNCLLDMYFDTSLYSKSYLIQPDSGEMVYRVDKRVDKENGEVSFKFTPSKLADGVNC